MATFKMDSQQGPNIEHRELCTKVYGSWMGGEPGEEWMHVYACMHIWPSPFTVH